MHHERARAAHTQPVPEASRLERFDDREASERTAQRGLDLGAGQVKAYAVMDPSTEAQRTRVGSFDVEMVRVGMASGVPIGRSEQHDHGLAGTNRHPPDAHLLFRRADGELDRRVVTEQLVGEPGATRGSVT